MEGVAVLGSLLFILIILVSCGFEFYELYQVRRELEEGSRSGNHILFPRHHYAELHRRNYYTPLCPEALSVPFVSSGKNNQCAAKSATRTIASRYEPVTAHAATITPCSWKSLSCTTGLTSEVEVVCQCPTLTSLFAMKTTGKR